MNSTRQTTRPFKFATLVLSWAITVTLATHMAELPAQDSTPQLSLSDRFTSEEGGFSILFPGKPDHTQGKLLTGTLFDTNRKEIAEERFIAGTKNEAFVVLYQESSEADGKTAEQILKLLETKTNEFVNVSNGFVQKKEAIQIDGNVPAYAFTLREAEKDTGGQMLTFFNDGKFYRIGAFGSREFVGRPTTQQFFDSLRLLNQPSTKLPPNSPRKQNGDAFVSEDAGFQINFPTIPKISVEDLTDDQGLAFVQTQFVSSTGDGAYLVSVQDSDESAFATAELRKSAFDATRDRLTGAVAGRVLEAPQHYGRNKHPGS